MRPIPEELNCYNQIKRQRLIKICPHKYVDGDYEVSVYVDANIQIKKNLNDVIEDMKRESGDFEICIPKHPVRKCIYREEKTVVIVKKDVKEVTEP